MRPGTEVVMRSAPVKRSAPTDTGVAFIAGIAERGRTDKANTLNNMADYSKFFGARTTTGLLYDACDAAFRSGVSKIIAGRVVGSGSTKDTLAIPGPAAALSIDVDSIGEGAVPYTVEVLAGTQDAAKRVLRIVNTDTNKALEQSPELSTPVDFAAWSQDSIYVRVRATGAAVPAVMAATPLAGGAVTVPDDDDKTAALPVLFPKALGPGQVLYAGATTTAMHVALDNFAKATNRVALIDLPDTPDDATLAAEMDAIRGSADKEELAETYGLHIAPWGVISGVTGNTTRTVPPSAVVAGLIARSDARFGNPNMPAAGANGQADILLGLSQPAWDDDTRTTLNDAGVAVIKDVYGGFRLYGYRTGADQDNPDSAAWDSFAAARLRMAITNELEILGEQFLFAQLDGKGLKIAEFNGAVTGVLNKYWALGALYGNTAAEAFVVDTGPTVNTPESLMAKELHCLIGIRTSPFNELSYFEVTKRAITEVL